MQRLLNPVDAVAWLRARGVTGLCADSRQIQPGDAFIAWPGAAQDARQFVDAALARGAVACLVEADGAENFTFAGGQVAVYAGLKRNMGGLADLFYGQPSRALAVVAVTGTNGKTSTAWWLAQALSVLPAPRRAGVIGTLGVGAVPLPGDPAGQDGVRSTGLTTPDPVTVHKTLHAMQRDGLRACAMEASSIGLEEQRMAGVQVQVAMFTNFTQDHLDYHGSMEAYWQSKRQLFAQPGLRSAVVNVDDSKGAELAAELQGSELDVWTVSCHPGARITAADIHLRGKGLHFIVQEGDQSLPLQTQVIGQYNVSNVLGVLAAMRALGVSLADAVQACSRLQPVPGRMECLGGDDQPLVAIDYAHTPDALAQVLAAVRPLAQQRGGQLWCVFGCGGDRDASKRPVMGAIAARAADRVVVTSDNPRSEKPEGIVAQILLGMPDRNHVDVEVDRARAIAAAIARAQPQDVVVLAGKGHERTQEQAGVKSPFSDVEHAARALRARTPVFTAQAIARMLPGSTLVGPGTAAGLRVHTDTRSLAAGDVFVALRGERFDANDLLAQAAGQGATVVVCHRDAAIAELPNSVACVQVDDTRVALQTLATAWRRQHADVRVIGVTGSNGKTTVTQMVAAILRAHCGADSWSTQGNLNNDIGVPLTVLGLRAHHRVAVVEMGMNHPGEIATLAAIAQPDVVLVNNAQREHLEFMHTVEAVARENGSAIAHLPAQGVAVFPADDAYTPVWQSLAGERATVTFGAQDGATMALQSAQWGEGAWQVVATQGADTLRLRLHIAGRHNVLNALAAAACARSAGVPVAAVEQGLAAFEPVKGRSRALVLDWQGVRRTLVDDTYNANPDSVRAAVDVLAELPGPRLLVLGDMGEVGDQGPQFHAEVVAYAHSRGIEQVCLLGELAQYGASQHPAARHFPEMESLLNALRTQAAAVHSILVKGSRFMRMERVVQDLQAMAQGAHAGARP